MALVGNRSVLLKSPGRNLAGTVACVDRSNYSTTGQMRNAAFSALAAIPNGHLAPSAWKLPQKGGGMSSVNFAVLSVGASGAGAMGLPATGGASFAVSVADAAGQLITSGTGSASFAITTTGNLLASLSGTGSASLSFAASGDVGALAWGVGTAQMQVSASLVSYAVGNMTGSTVDNSVLTSDAIASAVWQALASANNTAGSMGQKLNSAASGGVDYAALGAAVWEHVSRTLTAGAAPTAGDIADAVWSKTLP